MLLTTRLTDTEQHPQGYTPIKWKTQDSKLRQPDSREMLLTASKVVDRLLKVANYNSTTPLFLGGGWVILYRTLAHTWLSLILRWQRSEAKETSQPFRLLKVSVFQLTCSNSLVKFRMDFKVGSKIFLILR